MKIGEDNRWRGTYYCTNKIKLLELVVAPPFGKLIPHIAILALQHNLDAIVRSRERREPFGRKDFIQNWKIESLV
jgi:hypothetical protein